MSIIHWTVLIVVSLIWLAVVWRGIGTEQVLNQLFLYCYVAPEDFPDRRPYRFFRTFLFLCGPFVCLLFLAEDLGIFLVGLCGFLGCMAALFLYGLMLTRKYPK